MVEFILNEKQVMLQDVILATFSSPVVAYEAVRKALHPSWGLLFDTTKFEGQDFNNLLVLQQVVEKLKIEIGDTVKVDDLTGKVIGFGDGILSGLAYIEIQENVKRIPTRDLILVNKHA